MTEQLKPYPEYKDSGLPWMGKVPAHWGSLRAKYLYREVDERSESGTETLCSVSHKTGVTPRKASVTMFKSETTVGYKVCRPDDLVINTLWAWMAALGVAKQVGVVSPAYGVYRPRRDAPLNPTYAEYLLRIEEYKAEYIARSTGVNASRLRLYPDDFLRIPFLLPPKDEQRQIANFLRAQDRGIASFIRNRRRLIEVMNEQKQAIINRAVTRGLDPDVPLKPSGVEWLGEIPEHWRVGRVKTELSNLNTKRIPLSGTVRGQMTQNEYDYYGASGVIDKVDDYLFDDELLLVAEDGANLVLRNLPLAIVARGKFWVNNHAHILKPLRGSIDYFAQLIESMDFRPWITGAAQPKLTKDRLMSVPIPVPPEKEQYEIVEWITTNTGELTNGIRTAKREIDLIREYRTRLIADVVTGKVDVRGFATIQAVDEESELSVVVDEIEGLELSGEIDDSYDEEEDTQI